MFVRKNSILQSASQKLIDRFKSIISMIETLEQGEGYHSLLNKSERPLELKKLADLKMHESILRDVKDTEIMSSNEQSSLKQLGQDYFSNESDILNAIDTVIKLATLKPQLSYGYNGKK